MLIKDAQDSGRKVLSGAGLESALLEAQLLLCHVTGLSRTGLIVHDDRVLTQEERERFEALLSKRAQGVPFAYLTGSREFYGLSFKVNEHTLIPRPATETLIEAVLSRRERFKTVLDLGTGSGAIALTLKHECPLFEVSAVDLDLLTLECAQENARALGTECEFLQGSWFEPVKERRFDLIVSNPPYIEEDDPHLKLNGLPYEPKGALVSGADGLLDLRVIIREAPSHLNAGGMLMTEHGYDQGGAVRALFAAAGFAEAETLCDLEGYERVTLGRKA